MQIMSGLIAAIFVAILAASFAECKDSVFRDCGASKPEAELKVKRLVLPPTIYVGKNNTIDVAVDIAKDLVPEDIVSMSIYKSTRLVWVYAPCAFGIGSCTLSLKEWFIRGESITCQIMEQFGRECEPNVEKGLYEKKLNLIVDKKIVPSIFHRFIPVSLPDSSALTCLVVIFCRETIQSESTCMIPARQSKKHASS